MSAFNLGDFLRGEGQRGDRVRGLLPKRTPMPVLVREVAELQVGSQLFDGKDDYRVIDRHKRHGEWWYKIINVKAEFEANAVWFSHSDAGELGIRGTRRKGRLSW